MLRKSVPDRRGRKAEKIMEWGNIVFAGLVVAQAFSDYFDLMRAVVGFAALLGAYFVADQMMKGGDEQ